MKKGFLKSVCICLALLSLFCTLSLSAHAEQEQKSWSISQDLTSVFDGTQTYYLYTWPEGYSWDPLLTLYYYDTDSITVQEIGQKLTASIMTPAPDSGIIMIRSASASRVYATYEATQTLNAYFSTDFHTNCYLIKNETQGTKISDQLIKSFYVPYIQPLEIDVTQLRDLPCYKLVTYDPSLSLCKTIGAIYQLDEQTLAYVDYTLLDNTHFDAYGNFSYRSGSVTLSVLLNTADTLAAIDSINPIEFGIVYESDADYETVGLVIFWIFFIFLGYLLPLAPLLVGLLLPQSAKRHRPKRWYALAVFAGLWLLAATVIFIILL